MLSDKVLKDREYSKQYRKDNLEKTKQYLKEYRKNNKVKIKEYNQEYSKKLLTRYKTAERNAKRREINFEISIDEYVILIELKCYYCDDYFDKVTTGSGLDRVDNLKGYIKDNCVSCCAFCNSIKSDTLTPEETRAAVKAIIEVREAVNKLKVLEIEDRL